MRRVLICAAATAIVGATAAADPLAEGRLLVHRHNCGACHAAFPPGASGPDLRNIGRRLDELGIYGAIRFGRSMRPGKRMPLLFQPSGETQAEQKHDHPHLDKLTDALAHYLLSQPPSKPPRPPEDLKDGDAQRGAELYRSVGCVACHSPDGARDRDADVLITWAALHHDDGLAEYLLAPATPLMPSLKLTPQEATDIAAWLKRDDKAPPREAFVPAPDLVKQGRELFHARRCASCHEPPDGSIAEPLPPVPIADWAGGCLAATSREGVPNYEFSDDQRAAILAASRFPLPKSPAEIVHHTLTAYRCYACHERDGKGGPSDKQRPFFKAALPGAESYGDFGTLPPKLDHVGRKLTRGWMRKILVEGHGEVRPYLATRMPHYRIPEAEVVRFLDALEAADRRDPPVEIDVSGLPRHQRGHYGRDLMGSKGLNCITCHGLKGKPALGAPVIDLTHTVERLRPGWFKEILLDPQSVQPGTLMPPLFLNRPKAAEEVEQIWTYLKELDQRRLPDGLLRTDDFELDPATQGRPIVFRTFLAGVGAHAIAVGYPQGTHLAFDSLTSQWVLVWKGRFLDAMSTWDDRFSPPAKPLGDDVYRYAPDQRERTFRGFRLDPAGVPTFLYTLDGELTEDTIVPQNDGRLLRTVTRAGTTTRQTVRLHQGAATLHHAP